MSGGRPKADHRDEPEPADAVAAGDAGGRRADPIVKLDGNELRIWVAMGSEYEYLVNGPIRVTVTTSNRIRKETTFLDAGFNGYGEEIIFKHRGKVNQDGAIPVSMTVVVPIDTRALNREFNQQDVPILVEIIVSDGQVLEIEGSNNGARAVLNVRGSE